MSQRPPGFAPGTVLAQVTLRVIVPLLGGVIAGLVADSIGDTAPRYVLIGLAGGTLISALWLRTFVVSSCRPDAPRAGSGGCHGHGEA